MHFNIRDDLKKIGVCVFVLENVDGEDLDWPTQVGTCVWKGEEEFIYRLNLISVFS